MKWLIWDLVLSPYIPNKKIGSIFLLLVIVTFDLGFFVSERLSLFPGVRYVHITKSSTGLIPEAAKFSSNGLGLQFNACYVFSKSIYLFVNPIPTFINTNGDWKTIWSGEVNLNKIIKLSNFKMNMGWSPNFTSEVHVFKVGATIYI